MKIPNYTGPYISDGKFQESVEFGETVPQDALDYLSRLHDTAYAHYKDYAHRRAADIIYYQEAKKLEGAFPQLAGLAVLVGNQVGSSVVNLVDGMAAGPLGFLYGAVKNMYNLGDFAMNEKQYLQDIRDLYAKDPIDLSSKIAKVKNDVYDPFSGGFPIDVGPEDIDTTGLEANQLYNTNDSVYQPYDNNGKILDDEGFRIREVVPFSLGRSRRRRRN